MFTVLRIVYNYATMRKFLFNLTLILVLAARFLFPESEVRAQSVTTSDLIALVNNIRTSYGLPALTTNSILMSTAQWTAETMVAQGIYDHLTYHGYPDVRTRIANAGYCGGSTVWATENWAAGYSGHTISDIQSQWADYQHMLPMTEANYTDIGAGIMTDSSGVTIYIVHAAYCGSGSSGSSGAVSYTAVPTTQFVEPVVTATPQADGSIVHTVKYGQTLYTIAVWYGVTTDQIKALNGLTSSTIYEGDKLIIRGTPTITATPTVTPTVFRPTRTPTATAQPTTPMPTVTPTPTPRPNLADILPKIDRQWLGLGLLVISAAGFFAVVWINFIKPMRKKE
ncbi:MAG: LysM peptidoglycan-binding domain-containing protein [Anaerolineaceae bacterium]|nr:LysM peptidoglycan-binding domain-containing protein [Anaerolineaceae bacterium]